MDLSRFPYGSSRSDQEAANVVACCCSVCCLDLCVEHSFEKLGFHRAGFPILVGHSQDGTVVLHAGVSSLEAPEQPFEEFFNVPKDTARAVNAAREAGNRVIALGTTVVRALETVANNEAIAHEGHGSTSLIITPIRPVRSVDGLLTGLHESRSNHLAILEAIAALHHLEVAYQAALRERYLWHEFGDSHFAFEGRA